ncbi:hypothetical protein [Aeromonas caviae]|uniref:Uncharacterized protein n=1 Tax=Aeromonas caviae TaxID=648 RepID=A0AA37FWR1_AERCA|nr:hypothetical protein [Aeromonas caviae]BBQ51555.1 hypothetical protein WP2S18C03_06360 [Aeromonas veronii]GJA20424.1 hypothetical protein KAM336_34450 [Aeromonas caviae]GJA29237.1 hypothetical protein KAM340_34040 [Aeromonas caviae]GJA65153.1 hypothetical protein KAM351_37640 [Aeromonas caviae]
MTIKAFVHTTQLELKDVLGISLKRSHIYEMIAAAYGYSTYASLQADAILLSNTKWQVALDVSAIEAREGANKSLGTKTHHSKLLILNG